MSWVKHRDKLHEAALSSVKSISKIKTITSKNGIPQRPPAQNLATLTSAPRSSKDLPSWRGEADFQAFWYLFHPLVDVLISQITILCVDSLNITKSNLPINFTFG